MTWAGNVGTGSAVRVWAICWKERGGAAGGQGVFGSSEGGSTNLGREARLNHSFGCIDELRPAAGPIIINEGDDV